jgi:hypothetical protein
MEDPRDRGKGRVCRRFAGLKEKPVFGEVKQVLSKKT